MTNLGTHLHIEKSFDEAGLLEVYLDEISTGYLYLSRSIYLLRTFRLLQILFREHLAYHSYSIRCLATDL